ncbi:hypothetical protein VW29_15350 [Devosia limi DSM 17137]|uniref:Allophanate hydrolase n=1 Tax=Devosia limi DSM 17137 TaxID=1121477 RepID=A0A0F5LKG0_9HYPH|nr:biotin-dependent carboxyltransferase family protein [Devosia limi]KKB82916.1 hypothetical protein VW29_15350 [Devosia limi DSM 17137]SHF51258.1 allophanate hydrolase [Devosia limi DSM 17137]
MTAILAITRAGPLTSVQDLGRFGMLGNGISAAGAMDRAGYLAAGEAVDAPVGAIEITRAGLDLVLEQGSCRVGFAGGDFILRRNGEPLAWPGTTRLSSGDRLTITPGAAGNYGYLRFDAQIDVPMLLGSLATSSRAQLGGFSGRALAAGDRIRLKSAQPERPMTACHPGAGPIRVIWGLHADLFAAEVRNRFVTSPFTISAQLDRMGVRLGAPPNMFASSANLSLVSDAIVPGDIQILGDGTPIVLMRDHQPTGGYPRIATVISADFDRFAQLRPGTAVAFRPVTVEHAHQLLRSSLK